MKNLVFPMTSSALHSFLSVTFSRLLPVLLGAAALLPADGWGVQGINNTFTTSTSSDQAVVFSGDGVTRFLTRLQALGTQPPGFDRSFNAAFGDPAV